MKTSIVILVCSLMIGIGPWTLAFDKWEEALLPQNVGALAGIVGGIVLAWLGASPIKPAKGGL